MIFELFLREENILQNDRYVMALLASIMSPNPHSQWVRKHCFVHHRLCLFDYLKKNIEGIFTKFRTVIKQHQMILHKTSSITLFSFYQS